MKAIIVVILGTIICGNAFASESPSDASYADEEGGMFWLGLNAIDHEVARVANDLAIAYQAKCGTPVSIRKLRSLLKDPLTGRVAIKIAHDQSQQAKTCAEQKGEGEICSGITGHSQYMSAVMNVTCTSTPEKN